MMTRLRKVAKTNQGDFNLQKAIKDFKKQHKITDKDLKNRNMSNPLYREWTDYMWENYPIWSMSSVAYILRGWSYLVGGYPYGGWYGHTTQDNKDTTSPDTMPGGDMGDSGGAE